MDCIPTVKSSLLRNGFPSQKILAEELGIAQSTVSNFLNGKPVDYANFVELCRGLGREWRDIADLEEDPRLEKPSLTPVTIAIAQSGPPPLVQQLHHALTAVGYEVFVAGPNSRLDADLKRSDYWVLLLSEESIASEIVLEEVRLVKDLHALTPQKPAILPICVDWSSDTSLSFDLLTYLEEIPAWQWYSSQDTTLLVAELLSILAENRTSLSRDRALAIPWNSHPGTQKLTIQPLPVAAPELPEGQIELASRFYIDRPPIESRCYETIGQPGSLIRIKAPRQMGKTSLMARILHQAEQQGSQTLSLNFQLANKRIFTNSDTFLRWFCASVGQALGKLDALVQCWQLADMIGSNQCCKAYFEQYLLSDASTSLTLGLDEVDRVFESPEIADDFFGLLRALHEEAKWREVWKKLRLIVVHSTEVYIPLDVNKSPFNVGLPIELPELNSQQVQELAWRHGLTWNGAEVAALMGLVGGHPYLIRVALYHIVRQDVTLDRLVKEAPTEAGIYSDHLRRHLWNLEKYGDLMVAWQEVVNAHKPVRLRAELGFKLNSMGLVKLEGNHSSPRCRLYELYFRDR